MPDRPGPGSFLRDLGHSLADLLFPPHCLSCGHPLPDSLSPLLCGSCRRRLHWLAEPWCRGCGAPFAGGVTHLCGQCLAKPPPFALARSALVYDEVLAGLITAWKFRGRMTPLATLAALARTGPGFADLNEPDLIVPVPLHPSRLRRRGFNQALQLARACFPHLSARVDPFLLCRRKQTVAQTGLSGNQRRTNLSGAFSLRYPERIENQNVLVVDDVWTTGTTVTECCHLLHRAGCARLEVFTLARSVKWKKGRLSSVADQRQD